MKIPINFRKVKNTKNFKILNIKSGASENEITNVFESQYWPELPFIELAKLRGFTNTSKKKDSDISRMKEVDLNVNKLTVSDKREQKNVLQ
jgi:hypothetical protein